MTRVVVIGAGIVGAATALELVKEGCDVTLLDTGAPGGQQAASYGNAAWLSPASIIPMSMPGLWRKVPGYLLDLESPLVIRWRHLPRLLPWLIRFIAAGATVAKVERTARALSSILSDAPKRHIALAAEVGLPEWISQTGLLYVYPERAAFEAEALSWRLRRDNGVQYEELEALELARHAPGLSPRYTFGAFVPAGCHCIDPGAYVAALVAHACAGGASFVQATATGFEITEGRLGAVLTTNGRIACDRAVVAAGAHSGALVRQLGDSIPLESERGYHVVFAGEGMTLPVPIMPSDGKMGITPMRAGLRLAGQVELANIDAPPDWRRTDILAKTVATVFPALGEKIKSIHVDRWMGNRPSTPDGLPVISQAGFCKDVVYAFGHGHIGLASGPMTGRLAADLVMGLTSKIDVTPFRQSRF